MSLRPGYLTVEGFDPHNGKRDFFWSRRQVEHAQKFGPEFRFYDIYSGIDVLKDPIRIYEGLKRDGKEHALCYVGRPKRYGNGWEAPAALNMLFLVCLTDDGVVFEWRWEMADDNDKDCPSDVGQRFTKQLWKR